MFQHTKLADYTALHHAALKSNLEFSTRAHTLKTHSYAHDGGMMTRHKSEISGRIIAGARQTPAGAQNVLKTTFSGRPKRYLRRGP